MSQTKKILVETSGLGRTFRGGDGHEIHALSDVSFQVEAGEFFSVVGPSGCGKSTLLHLLAGLDQPNAGRVRVDGDALEDKTEQERTAWRGRNIGMLFQNYNLAERLNAQENVMLPLLFAGIGPREAREKALDLLQQVRLADRAQHLPCMLSGGQQQRVALARALANDPILLLADEPTANLDSASGEVLIDLLQQRRSRQSLTVITATHDSRILDVSDHIASLCDGRLEEIRNCKDNHKPVSINRDIANHSD